MSIFDAIKANNLIRVQTLIAEGCNLKRQYDQEGEKACPIFYAAHLGRLEIMETMLKSKTRLSKSSLTDALIEASLQGYAHIVKLLIKSGANIDAKPGYHTPLTAAVYGNHLDVVKILIEAGARVDLINGGGVYPLLMAALYGHQEAFDYLEPLTLSENKRREAKKELLERDQPKRHPAFELIEMGVNESKTEEPQS